MYAPLAGDCELQLTTDLHAYFSQATKLLRRMEKLETLTSSKAKEGDIERESQYKSQEVTISTHEHSQKILTSQP